MLLYQIIVLVLFLGTSIFTFLISLQNYNHRNSPIPECVQDVYVESKYQKWLAYFMTHFRFESIQNTVNTILILLLLFLGGVSFLYEGITSIISKPELQVVLFIGAYFILSFIVDLVFSYISTFKIEEKYGFNKTTKKRFVSDKIKSLLLTIVLGGGLIYLIAVIYEDLNQSFYIYTYLVLATILILMNLLYVKLFVPIFNKLTPLEDGELKTKIIEFAQSVGYEVGKISVINASIRSTKLNAYFSGFGKMKQIVLYDTLIQKMSVDEIVSVLAHEIGHNKHKHIISGMIRSLVILGVYMFALYAVLNLQGFYTAFGIDRIFLGFGLILFLVLLSPLEVILGLILNTISRKHEYQADAYAAKHYKKDAMISALKVLARNNFSNLSPDPLYVKLMYSHPPISDRINAIQENFTE